MTQISFGSLPGTSALFLDYLYNWTKVQRFYDRPYTLESILEFGRVRLGEVLPHRERLCRALAEQQRSWGGSAASVEKLAGGAVAVVAGQQPALFTGPNYTILKAITAIKLARALNDAGVPTVPVFWIAAEDHDYEEIQSTTVLNKESNLQKLRVDLSNSESSPVGWLRLNEDVKSAVADCLAALPQSEFLPELRAQLEASYQPDVSTVDAFARLMLRLFGDSGLILANPLHPELKAIGEPTLRTVAQKNAELRNAVIARSRAISEVGYHEQVKVDEGFTGLFALRDKSRQVLKPEDLPVSAMFSANVLVRPVLQDTIFPNVALIAGPAEIAYLAQAAAVYRFLGRPATPVFPRISATVLEARVSRALRKYGLQFDDAFHGKESMKRKAVESVRGVDMFEKVKRNVTENIESLRGVMSSVDPTLIGALETARQKMMYQVETLETKFVNAEAKRNDLIEKQLDLIGHSIFPEKKLQERVFNVTSFIARYGSGFLKRLEDSLTLDSTRHQVVEL
jgi:uncharacterized protein YllA (UPF0747 family)